MCAYCRNVDLFLFVKLKSKVMKTKSVIRKILGILFLVCLCQAGFAQKRVKHQGVPIRDVESYSITFPLTVAVTIDNRAGVLCDRALVEVYYDCYFYTSEDHSHADRTIEVINGRVASTGMIMNSKTIIIPSATAFGKLRIEIGGLTKTYKALIDINTIGFIDIEVRLYSYSVYGTLKDAAGHEYQLEFE